MIAAVLVLAVSASSAAVDVRGDDARDRFTGTGGIVLPPGAQRGVRLTAATCADCRWRMTDPCAFSTAPQADTGCRTVPAACAEDGSLLRAFISRDGGASWEYLGLHCIPESGPVTTATIGPVLQGEFERGVPAGTISMQPPAGVLPHLPVIFDSGQPQSLPASEHLIAGVRVRLVPQATWTWDFGDGATLTTVRAGSRYPDTSVSHVYRASGAHLVRLRTVWRAEYSVEGVGPIPVPEPVVQEASMIVRVGQGRAVLVP